MQVLFWGFPPQEISFVGCFSPGGLNWGLPASAAGSFTHFSAHLHLLMLLGWALKVELIPLLFVGFHLDFLTVLERLESIFDLRVVLGLFQSLDEDRLSLVAIANLTE